MGGTSAPASSVRVSDEVFHAGRRLMNLTERVADERVRLLLSELSGFGAFLEITRLPRKDSLTQDELDQQFGELVARGETVQDALGQLLRSNL